MRNGTLWGVVILGSFLFGVLPLRAGNAAPAAESPFWGFAFDGYPITEARLEREEKATGLAAQLVVFFLQWPSPGDLEVPGFPQESLDAVWSRGGVPCVTWEPMYYRDGQEIMIPFEEIIGGRYDAYILEFAGKARGWGRPFMIRFAHEMNLERYHWGTTREAYGPKSPDLYVKMFRHVVSLFRQAGAQNALWVFCPNAESLPNASFAPPALWNRVRDYYPGDSWVDILGMDGYNWGTSQVGAVDGWDSRWQSFEEIFSPLWRELRGLAPYKPIVVFETASVGEGGDRLGWIREAFETMRRWNIKGIVWFQVRKDCDWRINREGDHRYADIVPVPAASSQEWVRDLAKGGRE
jgi:hypothetical protein